MDIWPKTDLATARGKWGWHRIRVLCGEVFLQNWDVGGLDMLSCG
jgi:hypothetical protein